MGIRLRDGVEVGPYGITYRRRSGPFSEGPGRALQPSQAGGLVLAVACGMDQPAGDVYLWRGFFSLPSWPTALIDRAVVDVADDFRPSEPRSGYLLALLDVVGTVVVGTW